MSQVPRVEETASSQDTHDIGLDAALDDPWDVVAKKMRADDEAKIKDCKEEIDTLLVYAGLFSVVLTVFNVEAYKTLQQDSGSITSAALVQISRQLSPGLNAGSTASNSETAFVVPLFSPPPAALRINILWFSSLVLSLASESLSMLVKQWLRTYLSREYTAAIDRVRLRYYHYKGLIKWRVFELAAICPLLLQISFILFFAGLSEFLIQLNHTVGFVISALIAVWLFGYTASIICPVFSYRCPYKSPLFKDAAGFPKRILTRLVLGCRSDPLPWFLDNLRSVKGDYEKAIRRDSALDMEALIQADAEAKDDNLSPALRSCLKVVRASGLNAVFFVRSMLSHRLDREIMSLGPNNIDFGRLSTRALLSSIDIVSDALETMSRSNNRELYPWIFEALSYLFTALDHAHFTKRRSVYSATDRAMEIRNRLVANGGKMAETCDWLLSNTHYIPGVSRHSSANQNLPATVAHIYSGATQESGSYTNTSLPRIAPHGNGTLTNMPSTLPAERNRGHTRPQPPTAMLYPDLPDTRAPPAARNPEAPGSGPVQVLGHRPRRSNRTGRRVARAADHTDIPMQGMTDARTINA